MYVDLTSNLLISKIVVRIQSLCFSEICLFMKSFFSVRLLITYVWFWLDLNINNLSVSVILENIYDFSDRRTDVSIFKIEFGSHALAEKY